MPHVYLNPGTDGINNGVKSLGIKLNEKKTRSRYGTKENFHTQFFPYYIFLLLDKTRQINFRIS
jgi:hypothetical protein